MYPQQAEVAADDSPLESWLAGQIFVWAMIFILLVVPWMMARRPSGRAPPLTETTSSATASGSRFTSDRERRLWLYTVAVMIAIYSTLSPARELAAALRERGLLGVSSGAVMLVVGMVIAVNWAKTRPGRIEVAAGLGVAAAYLATMVRMPVPESHSHLFEYGLVAMLIDQALTERRSNSRRVPVPPLLALVATAGLGWIDEGIQAFLPNRVYDLVDVGQNAAFALMAITSSLFMRWARSLDILGPIRRLPAGDGQDSYATGVSQMTLFKALATVVGTAIGFGIAGTGIGAFLGRFTPALFRLFPLRDLENLDPSELGGSVKYRLDAHLRTKLTDESAAHLLSAVRAAVEQQGVGEADSSGLLWNSAGHQVLVSAHAEGDGTRVRVVVDRRASLAVTGALSVLGAFAFAVAVVASGETGMLESVPLGVSMIVAGAAGSLALGRAAWASSAREIRQRVGSLMDAVGPLLAQTASGSAAFEEAAAEDGEADAMRTDEGAS